MDAPTQDSTIKLLKNRVKEGYISGSHSDGYNIGLAVEGGGMRGVISGSMMIALRDLGVDRAIDGVYGTSSGAMNATYFAYGDTWRALSMYYQHLAKSDFIEFKRILKGKRPVRIDTVMEIMDSALRIDYEVALDRLRTRGYGFALSRVDEPGVEIVSELTDGNDLRSVLRIGAWLPIISGVPLKYGDGRYMDGGIFCPAPFYVGIRSGCTHVLQLSTRVEGPTPQQLAKMERFMAWRFNKWSPGAGAFFLSVLDEHKRTLQRIGYDDGEVEGAIVKRLACLPGTHDVGRLTNDPWVLLDGAQKAYDRVFEVFGSPAQSFLSLTHDR